jgi:citrate lyase subunit beta/citryl-CoA lyase
MIIRSLLFVPANRPDLIDKLPRAGADAVAVDLEDGTPEREKPAARRGLARAVSGLRARGLPSLLFVRVNDAASPHADADLQAALETDIDGLVVPKLDAPSDLQRFGAALSAAGRAPGRRPLVLVGLLETMAGVIDAGAIAAADPHLCALGFGGEDFIREVGGRRTPEGREVLYARSRVVLAARAAGLLALDQVVVEIRDAAQFRRDGVEGRNLGYTGKMCLLPRQVALANEIFTPTPEEIAWSRRLVEAYDVALAAGRGVIEFEGRMVDPPLLKRAQGVLDLAGRVGGRDRGRTPPASDERHKGG